MSAKVDNSQDKAEARVAGVAPVNQTTDAEALAAIDTSGYVLPAVKVPGRRGRKPKEFTPENDEVAALNAVERAELKAVDKAKAKDRKAKEKALLKDAFSSDTEASEEELEIRRQKLKALIKSGKERGFLTYSEINDHLPDNIVDPEAIEGIIGTFNDMGIAVYEHAPDAETLLLSDNVATVTSDDEAEAAAEAALSTVDSDFGRTTDPVRMYMREMGSVELLTRRDRDRQAHRRRPARHDPGDLRLPGDDRRDHRRRPPHRTGRDQDRRNRRRHGRPGRGRSDVADRRRPDVDRIRRR
jgi:RNA polymerase primary sigma factor